MSQINVAEQGPVGEFGSKEWCEACAKYGIELLEDAKLPKGLAWGFSEVYAHPPARMLTDGRKTAAYYIMVKDGMVSGGDGAPEECRALPGFHVEIQWAAICNQSGSQYGRAGQRQRSADEQVLYQEIAEYLGRDNPLGLSGGPERIWPAEIAAAIRKGAEDGGGLHNIAARLQQPSPEFADMPTTDLGVPVFSRMTDNQKDAFLALCAVAS